MGKMRCKCSNVLRDTMQPNDMEGYLVTCKQGDFDGAIESFELVDKCHSVWECDNCGRLAIFKPGWREAVFFTPESGKYEELNKGGKPLDEIFNERETRLRRT